MNKKKIIFSVVTIAAIIVFVLWVWIINMNPFRNMDVAEIETITLHNPSQYFTITEQEDIQVLFKELQSMHLSRKIGIRKDGFAFLMTINLKNGKKINMSILSNDININRRNYRPDKNYCNSILEIFDKLSEKYERNPA